MRPALAVALLLLCVPLIPLAAPQSGGGSVLLVEIDGVVTQGTRIHVQDAIREAEDRGVPLVIRLDTPGGLVDATLEIHQAIIASRVPVLTFVGPQGGFAASAGTLILLMGQPNGMAPSTTIGSAQPVTVSPTGESEPAGDKITNFLVEQVRIIAERTGRDPDTAERFVSENLNLEPQEARDAGMVDVIASDVAAFLDAVDGRTALTATGNVTLHTQGARIVTFEKSFLANVVDLLSNPQISFLFILAGTYALIFGLANPGTYAPETIGAILLVLGFVGLGLFSAGTAGIILLVLGLLFFVAEVFTPTHGLLSVAGVICIFFAVLFLVDDEPLLPVGFLRTFYWVGVGLALVSGAAVFAAVHFALRTRRKPTFDVLRGAIGTVTSPEEDTPRVLVHGEVWRARADGGAALPSEGGHVRVVGRDGLTLIVQAAEPADTSEE